MSKTSILPKRPGNLFLTVPGIFILLGIGFFVFLSAIFFPGNAVILGFGVGLILLVFVLYLVVAYRFGTYRREWEKKKGV